MNIKENLKIENNKENKVLINSIEINKKNGKISTLKKNKRIEYFDWLRILCCFSVIINHVSAQKWYISPIISHEWKIFNIYDSAVRFGLPIFFMISGAIFIEKDISFSIILKKYIKKIYI